LSDRKGNWPVSVVSKVHFGGPCPVDSDCSKIPSCGRRLPQPGQLMIGEELLGYHNNNCSKIWLVKHKHIVDGGRGCGIMYDL